nr:MAG TPA: hypothetical protein [Bacteriophage sp.]
MLGKSQNISAIAEIFLLILTISTIGKNCKFGIDFNVMFYYNTSHKVIKRISKWNIQNYQ